MIKCCRFGWNKVILSNKGVIFEYIKSAREGFIKIRKVIIRLIIEKK